MKIYDDILMEGQSIFKNEDALDFEWLPPVLPYREGKIKQIADATKPLFDSRKPSNLFITGSPGIGKTSSIKFVLNELSDATDEITPIYVNCWRAPTQHSIFLEIARQINLPFPDKGIATESIAENVLNKLGKNKGCVLAFDEVDKSESMDFIYKLFDRLGKSICLILITNNKEFLEQIDERLKSRLCLESIHFEKYNKKEIEGILKERIKYSFQDRAFSAELSAITESVYDRGDIRLGIFLIHKAGRHAEKDASKKVEDKHIKSAMETIAEFRKKNNIESLTDVQSKIYELVKKESGKVSGYYYELLQKNGMQISSRYFRENIKYLENSGLLKTKETGKGFHGRSRIIELFGQALNRE